MPWPLSQDYNEAVQSPASCFADPELKQAEVATNALGLPMPCSGNFADVYEMRGAQKKWAVKCFTREIPGIRERYVEISKYLQQNPLPFMVDFRFLEQGIRIRGQWYPILKMDWVQGFAFNHFVRDNVEKPQLLDVLCQIWVKLAGRLHEANLAHCDLQHGNVLLVPGRKASSVGIRLVDYDGMCVPSLTLLKSIEVGHPNYQHPERLRAAKYGLEIDRFPSLVIYTALSGLMARGRALWDKYDNGDNLLFKQSDLDNPEASPLLEDLKRINPQVRRLAELVTASARKPLEQTPLLDEVAPKSAPTAITRSVPTAAPAPLGRLATPATVVPATDVPVGLPAVSPARRGSSLLVGASLGLIALLGLAVGGLWLVSNSSSDNKDDKFVKDTKTEGAKVKSSTKDKIPDQAKIPAVDPPLPMPEPMPEPIPVKPPQPPRLTGAVKVLAQAPDRATFLTFAADDATLVRVFENRARTLVARTGNGGSNLDNNQTYFAGLASLPNGFLIGTGDLLPNQRPAKSTVLRWDASTQKMSPAIEGLTGPVKSLHTSANGQKFLVLARDKDSVALTLHETATGRQLQRFAEASLEIVAAALSPDGNLAAAVAAQPAGAGNLVLWDVGSGRVLLRTRVGPVHSMCFAGNGRLFTIGDIAKDKARLSCWEADTGKLLWSDEKWLHRVMATSGDGQRIYVSHDAGQAPAPGIALFDVASGGELYVNCPASGKLATALAVSRDGRTVFSSDDSGTTLWTIDADAVATPMPGPAPDSWFVLFRSADPVIWDSNVDGGPDRIARRLENAPPDIRYLRLRRVDNDDFVIAQVTRDTLGRGLHHPEFKFGWEGFNRESMGARYLGIYAIPWTAADDDVSIRSTARSRGWGFGRRGDNNQQGYSWNGKPIAPTVFEIAVKRGNLDAGETSRLISKLVIDPEPTPAPEPKTSAALVFQGKDHVEIENSQGLAQPGKPFTAELWVYVPSGSPDFFLCGNYHHDRQNQAGWRITGRKDNVGGKESLLFFPSFGSRNATQTPGAEAFQVFPERWHHLALVVENRNARLWVDGQLHRDLRSAPTMASSSDNIFLGMKPDSENQRFDGQIRAFRFSSGARYVSPFKPPTTFASDKDSQVLLEFVKGERVLDRSGHNRHGKIVGAKWEAVAVVPPPASGGLAFKPWTQPARINLSAHTYSLNAAHWRAVTLNVAAKVVTRVTYWDVNQGLPKGFFSPEAVVENALLMPDGKHAVLSLRDQPPSYWDLQERVKLRDLEGDPIGAARLELSADGRWLVAACGRVANVTNGVSTYKDCVIARWDMTTFKLAGKSGEFLNRTGSVAVSANGGRVLATNESEVRVPRQIMVWEPADGAKMRAVCKSIAYVTNLDISPDGRLALISDGKTSTCWLWDLDKDQAVHRLAGAPRIVRFSPDGRLALLASETPIDLLDVASGKIVQSLTSPFKCSVRDAVWSSDGKRILAVLMHPGPKPDPHYHGWEAEP